MLAFELRNESAGPPLALAAELHGEGTLAVMGPSGAGKSSLLRALAGLLEPEQGRVELGGDTWLDTARRISVRPERRGVGFVFQSYALFPGMSARDNVAFGIAGGSRRERRARACELLERLGVGAHADARPGRLSGGERQRVALARALGREPRLLLLDEPLSALDPRTRAEAAAELATVLAASPAPAIIVTHSFEEAAVLGDEIAVLDGGRLIQRGTAAELAAKPASGLVGDLAGASVLVGEAVEGRDGLTLVTLAGGGSLLSTDTTRGPVAVSVFPWDVTLAAAPARGESALNHLAGEIASVTDFGNRARVAVRTPQPLVAEITAASVERLRLRPGDRVAASFKATATRLSPRSG
jgi:molybdate transport system ATP-binding protein